MLLVGRLLSNCDRQADNETGTIPTRRGGTRLPYPDMTPGEIAHSLGFSHLCDILTPAIHHHVRPKTLAKLQEQFHLLIQDEMSNGNIPLEHLNLPELLVLTELETPEMLFSIRHEAQHGSRVCCHDFKPPMS